MTIFWAKTTHKVSYLSCATVYVLQTLSLAQGRDKMEFIKKKSSFFSLFSLYFPFNGNPVFNQDWQQFLLAAEEVWTVTKKNKIKNGCHFCERDCLCIDDSLESFFLVVVISFAYFDWLVDWKYFVAVVLIRSWEFGERFLIDGRSWSHKMKCRWRRRRRPRPLGRPIFGAAPAVTPGSLSCDRSSSNQRQQRPALSRGRQVCWPICWTIKTSRKWADSSLFNAAAHRAILAANSNSCDTLRRWVVVFLVYLLYYEHCACFLFSPSSSMTNDVAWIVSIGRVRHLGSYYQFSFGISSREQTTSLPRKLIRHELM